MVSLTRFEGSFTASSRDSKIMVWRPPILADEEAQFEDHVVAWDDVVLAARRENVVRRGDGDGEVLVLQGHHQHQRDDGKPS